MGDPRTGAAHGAGRSQRPEDLLLELARRVSLRTWLAVGVVLAILLALALWALVALWQAVGEQAPGWHDKVVGLAGEAVSAGNQQGAAEPGAAIISGVVTEAKQQAGQYAAELDRVVPGASAHLQSAAQAWLGSGAADAGEGEGSAAEGAAGDPAGDAAYAGEEAEAP